MASITSVVVQYTADDGSSRQVTLDDIARHCRAERVGDLLDDLVVLCEDVADRRRPEDRGSMLSVVPDA